MSVAARVLNFGGSAPVQHPFSTPQNRPYLVLNRPYLVVSRGFLPLGVPRCRTKKKKQRRKTALRFGATLFCSASCPIFRAFAGKTGGAERHARCGTPTRQEIES